jgi:hypothetical protein
MLFAGRTEAFLATERAMELMNDRDIEMRLPSKPTKREVQINGKMQKRLEREKQNLSSGFYRTIEARQVSTLKAYSSFLLHCLTCNLP